MLHSKGPFTLTENSWSDTSLYDGSGRRVASLSIEHDCDENSQDDWEKRQAADASVMLEALNVLEATGLTPSQLQARVAELEVRGLEMFKALDLCRLELIVQGCTAHAEMALGVLNRV